MSGMIRADRDGPIGWIIVDNWSRRNALSATMFARLAQQLGDLDADPEVRVMVLRGAGDKAFAAGADIGEPTRRSSDRPPPLTPYSAFQH